ncbi:hypothetical protein E1301_Tti018729 [Triplophysa tibetana]|uniref:Uncharacterized protein n=1 Tax=Triplophysa tibetana TaxID=1572043 RepID=A0A5A9PJM9_9TELE|nr:hypothetical protein E1301_Tti018729 [Triplophysa tibetana]
MGLDFDFDSANSDVDTPGFKVRKHQISTEFKFKPLSPLLESNLSDVSDSEKQPHILNTVSSLPDPLSIQSRPASHVSSSLPSQENPDPDSMKIKKQTHDGNAEKNAPIMQDAGTQTADFSHNACCDVSVQCSLIHANSINSTSVHTTRRQSVHFKEVSAGASATKVQAQTQPKLPKGLSSRKSHRQASMKKTLIKRPLRKGLGINTVRKLMDT